MAEASYLEVECFLRLLWWIALSSTSYFFLLLFWSNRSPLCPSYLVPRRLSSLSILFLSSLYTKRFWWLLSFLFSLSFILLGASPLYLCFLRWVSRSPLELSSRLRILSRFGDKLLTRKWKKENYCIISIKELCRQHYRISTRRAQLSVAAKVVRPTGLLKNVRYWFTIWIDKIRKASSS